MYYESIYKVLKVSRQAVYQHFQRQSLLAEKLSALRQEVEAIRSEHPGCGLAKMHGMLRPDGLGRDRFVALFMSMGYGVQRKRNPIRTTHALRSRYYPNLASGAVINCINQLWQSDITYFMVGGRYYYLTFIIDVYSRQIVGYAVSDSLRAEANLKALKMAFKLRKNQCLKGLIHHSDRGSQYIDKRYIKLLESRGVSKISMCECAQDNAYTERLNGTIKNEYLSHWHINDSRQLSYRVRQAVRNYNTRRPHSSLPASMSPVAYEQALKDWQLPPVMTIKSYQDAEVLKTG